jgi:excisionase family DNA binding protein
MDMPNLYTVKDVAEYLDLSTGTIYSLVSRGEIDSIKIGRARRFTGQHVKEYVNRDRQLIIDATSPTTYVR